VSPHGGQDWLGIVIVLGIGVLCLAALYIEGADWLRREDAELQRVVDQIAPRCEGCGCRVQAGHEVDGEECRELQAERAVRAEVRAREWSE
jgi:hypothetical protein